MLGLKGMQAVGPAALRCDPRQTIADDGQDSEGAFVGDLDRCVPLRVFLGNLRSYAELAIPHSRMVRTDVPDRVQGEQPRVENSVVNSEQDRYGLPHAPDHSPVER